MAAPNAISLQAPSLFAFLALFKQTNAGDLPSKLMARYVFSSSMNILQFSWLPLSVMEASLQNNISAIDACVHETRFWDKNSELTFTHILIEGINYHICIVARIAVQTDCQVPLLSIYVHFDISQASRKPSSHFWPFFKGITVSNIQEVVFEK